MSLPVTCVSGVDYGPRLLDSCEEPIVVTLPKAAVAVEGGRSGKYTTMGFEDPIVVMRRSTKKEVQDLLKEGF